MTDDDETTSGMTDDDETPSGMTDDDETAAPLDGLRERLLGDDDSETTASASDDVPPGRESSASDDVSSEPTDRDDDAADAPLAELRRDLDEGGATSTADDLFSEMAVDDVDSDSVWDALATGDDDDSTETATTAPSGDDVDARRVDAAEHVVEKRSFCQQCEHFASPPTVACGHEGTEIVELVDRGHFRVRNCPMVDADDAGDGFE